MKFILDIYEQQATARAQDKADGARDEVSRLRTQLEDLRRQTDSLTLACQAMWELLREQTRLSDAELIEKMQQIDVRDGEADGRISAVVGPCPTCGRRNRSTRHFCVYCGAPLPQSAVFSKP